MQAKDLRPKTENELTKQLKDLRKELKEVSINDKHLVEILKLVQDKTITDKVGKELLLKLIKKDYDVIKYVEENKLRIVADEKHLRKSCEEVINENKDSIEKIKSGDYKVLNFLIGEVMRKTNGVGKPEVIVKILKQLLNIK